SRRNRTFACCSISVLDRNTNPKRERGSASSRLCLLVSLRFRYRYARCHRRTHVRRSPGHLAGESQFCIGRRSRGINPAARWAEQNAPCTNKKKPVEKLKQGRLGQQGAASTPRRAALF